MRAPPPAVKLTGSMTEDTPYTQVALKLNTDREPISGSLQDEHGHDHVFCGWMELISTIAQAHEATSPRGHAIGRGGNP